MFLVTIIKLYFGYIGFYLFLRKRNINVCISIVFSLIFVCSGWVGVFLEQPVFISFYVFIPYVLLGLEEIIDKKTSILFSVSVGLMISANFYLAWSFCFYLLLYWVIRYIQLNEKFIFKDFLKESLKILGYFMIGVLISSAIWMPCVSHILQSGRTENGGTLASFGIFWQEKALLRILQNFIIPFIYSKEQLYMMEWYYFNQVGLYSGMLTMVCTGIYCFKKNKTRYEKANLWLVIISLLTLLSPKIGMIFHFTYSLRYTYFIMLSFLIVGSASLNELYDKGLNNKKGLVISCGLILLLSIMLCFVIPYIQGMNINDYVELKLYIVSMACIVLYFLIFLFIKNKKILLALLLILCVTEITYQNKRQVRSIINAYQEAIDMYDTYKSYDIYEVTDYLKSYDNSFYRIAIENGGNNNFSMVYDIPTVKTYDSTYEFAIREFLDINRLYPDIVWDFNLNNPQLFELLDIKYFIAKNYHYYEYGESIYETSSGWKIYLVNEDNYLLRSYNSFISIDVVNEMADAGDVYYEFEVLDKLKDSVAVRDEDVDNYSLKYKDSEELKLNPDVLENNYVCFNFECKDDEFIYLSIPNDKGWVIKDNGKEIESIDSNGGFIGLEITKGSHKLELTYNVPYLNEGRILSLCGVVICVGLNLWTVIKKRKVN